MAVGDNTAASVIWFPGEATGKNSGGASASIPVNKTVYSTGAGTKLTAGVGTLDGTNPTSVAHGLTTCQSASVTLSGIAAQGLNTCVLTFAINGANIDVYAWKPTGAGNPTLIAATSNESFYWTAAGI